MEKRSRYITIDGSEGLGKTTQTEKLCKYLMSKGYSVLSSKEPGSPHSPLTMELRKVMLDMKYDGELTMAARELISQAIRSIHLDKVISPALFEYDYIIQDRSLLSGYAYGEACGNRSDILDIISRYVVDTSVPAKLGLHVASLYDDVVMLVGNVSDGLYRATCSKQEFIGGDAMESRGTFFLEVVEDRMTANSTRFNTHTVSVDNRDIEEVFENILVVLGLDNISDKV